VQRLMTALEIRQSARDKPLHAGVPRCRTAKAQRVIQSLVSIFVEFQPWATRKDTDTAKVFINEQIKSYEAKLEEPKRA